MFRIVALTFFIILGLVVGCGKKSDSLAARSDTLDISPAPMPVPAAEPVAQPVFDEPPVRPLSQAIAMTTPAPTPAFKPAAPSNGTTYVVKKGETLTSIARKQYGTGDWKKIAAANPGLQPNNIKAGQKIVIP